MAGFDSGYTFSGISGSSVNNFSTDIQSISKDYIANTSQLSSSNIVGFDATARAAARNTIGDVLKVSMLSNTDLSRNGTYSVLNTQTTYANIVSYVYQPIEATSYLLIDFFCAYTFNTDASGNDQWSSAISIGGSVISYATQQYYAGSGGGTRSGVLFPLTARYTNSSTATKTINIQLKANNSDDTLYYYGDNGMWLRITEIQR
jgi:hypothetical protein